MITCLAVLLELRVAVQEERRGRCRDEGDAMEVCKSYVETDVLRILSQLLYFTSIAMKL